MNRIDTHLHVLLPDRFRYPWTEGFAPLQGTFSLEDYHTAGGDQGITGSLFMEVDVDPEQAADEAAYFCGLAEDPANRLLGVIASGRPESEGFEAHLDRIAHPALKGIRRILHMGPEGLSRLPLFRTHIAMLGMRGLPFDLCVRADQLAEATELVDACPDTLFVLDHCGNPDIAGGGIDAWRDALTSLAERENVMVKLSGIPAACPPGQANAETLKPWVETTLDRFGWDRCVWGGDWPVCTLNGSLASWCIALDDLLADESESHKQKLFQTNAQRIYHL